MQPTVQSRVMCGKCASPASHTLIWLSSESPAKPPLPRYTIYNMYILSLNYNSLKSPRKSRGYLGQSRTAQDSSGLPQDGQDTTGVPVMSWNYMFIPRASWDKSVFPDGRVQDASDETNCEWFS